jgi:alanine-glyoxylate transaminase/serine-glyoxylate transaminase/serine-pyruvate transaminase
LTPLKGGSIMEQYKLFIPGPVEVSADVLEAMGAPIQPHYGPYWTKFYKETIDLLRKVFQTNGDIYIMVGSGTVAIDACLGSAFCTGEKVIVGTNGFFGDRLKWIAEGYGLQPILVTAEWGKPLTPADFEIAFKKNPEAKGAAVVHLETSTTIQNPIEKIGPIVRKHGGTFVVDAVSSLGGSELAMDDWCIDLCASATQKCLGAPPGLGPVAVGKRAWEAIDCKADKAHGWYCDLRTWRKYAIEWGDWHPSPITMAVNTVSALNVALQELIQEGIATRLERYRKLALRLRAGLGKVGFVPFTPEEQMSPVLTAGLCPEGISSGQVVSYLSEKHHIKISGGLGVLKEKMIRIGTMSPQISEKEVDHLLAALQDFMQNK